MKVLSALFVVLLAHGVLGFNFTGHADVDFAEAQFTEAQLRTRLVVSDGLDVAVPPEMSSNSLTSGFDILNVYFYYAWEEDTMYVGVECSGICGDLDGDGDPSQSSFPSVGEDNQDMCSSESFSLMFWPGVPENPTYFLPTVITGINFATCLVENCTSPDTTDCDSVNWDSWAFNGADSCMNPDPSDPCISIQSARVLDPGNSGYGSQTLQLLYGLPKPVLFANPNSDAPHIEFRMERFSELVGFSFVPGPEGFSFGFAAAAQAVANYDADHVIPQIVSFPCGEPDFCGVCGGQNETCMCLHYLGYDLNAVDYALLRWSISASLAKINDTLDLLYAIKQELPNYDYKTGEVSLVDYIDTLHAFCEECLDSYDFAQVWFADLLAGNCAGSSCGNLDLQAYQLNWALE